MASFGKYEIPYLNIDKQIEIKNQLVTSEEIKEKLSAEFTSQLGLLKKFRQQKLQDAVHGKLLNSSPPRKELTTTPAFGHPSLEGGEHEQMEDARVLLEKIRAEKQQLIAQGKIKKEKPLPEIKPEEIPFEIPENWMWCRLGEI